MNAVIETNSEQETYELGIKLASYLKAGQVITLNGDLGAGKTAFAKGIATGLGITEAVTSPTFTLVQEYNSGRFPLYHFDVYRLNDWWQLEDVGYEEYFFGEGICLVEWAERIQPLLPEDHLAVFIDRCSLENHDCRRIEFSAKGRASGQLLKELRKICLL